MTLKETAHTADEAPEGERRACDSGGPMSDSELSRAFTTWLHEQRYAANTIATYVSYATRAAAHVGDLAAATLEDLEGWWATLKDSAATRNQARKALVAWYRSCGQRAGGPAVELPTQPERQGLPRPVDIEVYEALVAAATRLGGIHEAAGVLMLTTGCRISEARTARWEALTLDSRSPAWRVLGKGAKRKGPKERVVPLNARCVTVLTRWRASCGSDVFVFPTAHGAWQGMISDAKMRALVHDLAEVAGVDRVLPHQLRHSVATLALERTVDLSGVQDLLGHADPATTRLYARVSPNRLRAIVDALPG